MREIALMLDSSTAFIGTCELKGPIVLLGNEAHYIANAVTKRKNEFATGRWCARKAMAMIGQHAQAILVGGYREPVWPEGVVGSISHTEGFYCALASTTFASVGIDVEKFDSKIDADIWKHIYTDAEFQEFTANGNLDHDLARFAIFSAKEAVYKCLFPFVGRFFEFLSVRIRPGLMRNRIVAELQEDLGQGFHKSSILEGRYYSSKTHILSAFLLNSAENRTRRP